ncbi:helix-turn-helix domain-containing protein [Streptomyces sp. NPDC047002]|uniref:helix-turn-helix domain-containing protein n=1 Tax=Streptomyces sp. NPDC047002 TaxID=3155475 RepID=UPI00345141D0
MTQSATRSTPRPAPAAPPPPPPPPPTERRRLREAKAMTVKQLASAVGVTQSTVRGWETGRTEPRGRRGGQYLALLARYAVEVAAAEAAEDAAEEARRAAARPEPAERARAATPTDDGRPGDADGPSRTADVPSGAAVRAVVGPGGRRIVVLTRPLPGGAGALHRTPEQAFDALYGFVAPGLVRQAYLLTGHRGLAREAVERAFQLAWQRWPEVARDRDPAGWVRAAAHEYALSPWHCFRLVSGVRAARPRRGEASAPQGRALRDALLALPRTYRRALLLYDGLGLDLPDTAAEAEASTPATAGRLLHAREAVAARLPELADPALLHERLDGLLGSVPVPAPRPARAVRGGGEARSRLWTHAALVLTVLVASTTTFTVLTAPRAYHPPEAPPERVTGVPVPGGPERLTAQDVRLRNALRAVPLNGPERLLPRAS